MILASIVGPTGGGGPDLQLHAPDGILTVPVALAMWAMTLVVLAIAVRNTNRSLDERAIPLMGVMAAFIFAAQMFNFQVIGGTSGHLLGGVLPSRHSSSRTAGSS
jgi:cobalt/nickel transport system permease protein